MPQSRLRRQGRQRGGGAASGRGRPVSFRCALHAASQRSGSAGLCSGALVPRAPPPRDRPSPNTPRCSRAHTHTRTRTQCPARRPLRRACSRLRCAARDPLLPPPRRKTGHLTACEAGKKGEPARVPWAAGAGQVLGRVRSRRVGVAGQGSGPPGGRVALAAAGSKARGCSAPRADPPVVRSPPAPLAPPPPPRASRQVPIAGPAPLPPTAHPPDSPLSLPLPLPTFGPAPGSAQTFSETPPERFQPKQQGLEEEEETDGGRERVSERHPGICSSGSRSGVHRGPAAEAAEAPSAPLAGEGG